MYYTWLLLFIIQISASQIKCLTDIKLIENYFNEKFIKSAVVFGCFNKNEQIEGLKALSKARQISVLHLNRRGIENSIKTNHAHIGVILNGNCDKAEEFLKTCGLLNFFDVKHHWLVISTSQSIIEKFRKVQLHINADIQVALKNGTERWAIIDVYNPASKEGGELKEKFVGFYHDGLNYGVRNTEAKYWTRRNMTGITLKTMVVFPTPFDGTFEEHLLSDANISVNSFNRFQHKLLRYCRDYYNYTMITDLGYSWGYPLPNGSFDGMVGGLEKKIYHFGSSPIFVRKDRIRIIDYGRNTWSWKAGFLFRSPKSRSSFELFFKPLTGVSWLITGCFALISIIILKTVTTYERRKSNIFVETTWSLSVMFILGAFCQQGSATVPRMASGRITAISIFFLSLLIYQFYSASIVSSLLLKPTDKIKNLKDLTESSLKVGSEDFIYIRDLFAHTSDNIVRKLYLEKIYGKRNTSHFFAADKGMSLVKDGGYAFHVEVATAYPIIEATFPDQAICELREVKLFKNTDLYSAYQKRSPLYDMLETCFQKLAERGILDKEKKHWHPRKPTCIQFSQGFTTFHIGLEEFYPALLILLIGIIGSLTVVVVEKYIVLTKMANKGKLQQTQTNKTAIPFKK